MLIFAAQPDNTVLNRALQTHVASRQAGQRLALAGAERQDTQILPASDLACGLLPPVVGAPPTVTDDNDMVLTGAGAANGFFVWQADIDPAFDAASGVDIPQVGLVFG